MKKYLMILLLIAVAGVNANAQFQIGVTGGLNAYRLDNFSFGDGTRIKDDGLSGFFAGVKAEYTSVFGIGAEIGAVYHERGKHDYKIQGIAVPVNLKYNFTMIPLVQPYLLAGCEAFFDVDHIFGRHTDDAYRHYAFNFGAGLRIVKHIEVGVTYQKPFGLHRDHSYNSIAWDRNDHNWQLSLAYMF